MPNCYVRIGEFLASPLEYKYHVFGVIVLHEVQLDNNEQLSCKITRNIAWYLADKAVGLGRVS